jgi:F-type H+-transporting ATPase subunit alpha
VGKSVSRVGGQAQRPAYRAVAGALKLAYAQFEELETFARFGGRLDPETQKSLDHGRHIRACLKQPELAPVSLARQIAVLLALVEGHFDDVPLDRMKEAEAAVQEAADHLSANLQMRLSSTDALGDADRAAITQAAVAALVRFRAHPKADPETAARPPPTRGGRP